MNYLYHTARHIQKLADTSPNVAADRLHEHWQLIASLSQTLALALEVHSQSKKRLKINPVKENDDDPSLP